MVLLNYIDLYNSSTGNGLTIFAISTNQAGILPSYNQIAYGSCQPKADLSAVCGISVP